jgi:hypothetical protein
MFIIELFEDTTFRRVKPGSRYEKRVIPAGTEIKPSRSRRLDPEEKAARAAARKQKHRDMLWRIWSIISNAVGNSIPDGDPIDYIMPQLRRMFNLGRDEWPEKLNKLMDQACRMHGYSKSYNDYLADMWDSYDSSFEPGRPTVLDLYSLTNNPEELKGYKEKDNVIDTVRGPKPERERLPNPWR